MKSKYTKKQIQEAIAYWKKQLNESINNCESDAVMMFVKYEAAYENGDENWLYVGKNLASICDALGEIEPQTWSYRGETDSTDSASFYKLLNAVKRDSVSSNRSVRVDIFADDIECSADVSFCKCEEPVDAYHVIYCD